MPRRLVRAMVFNRLCDARSKLGLLRWFETTRLPGVDPAQVTHQRLLRTMDALQAQADGVASLVSGLLRPLIDRRLSVVAVPGRRYTALTALTGNAGANVLDGGLGNDTLNGAAGADTLIGAQGTTP